MSHVRLLDIGGGVLTEEFAKMGCADQRPDFPLTGAASRSSVAAMCSNTFFYEWESVIATPEEFTIVLEQHGMQVQELSGGGIARNPLSTLLEVRCHKHVEINVVELGQRLELKHDPDLSLNYLGHAKRIVDSSA